jgi:hypothetical protein
MARWLDKVLPPPARGKRPGLPALNLRENLLFAFQVPRSGGKLPNASIIYGAAAAALLVLCLYFLFTGMWLTGILLLLPTGCLLGFALHFMNYPG